MGPSRASGWGYGLLMALLLLYAFPYQARLNNPNENVRLYMTAAIVEHGTYRIDALRERWGWVNDAATHNGHVYSVKAPGTSWLGVPGYAAYLWGTRWLDESFDRTVALWVCRATATIIPTWLFLWWLLRWFGAESRHPALRVAALTSIGFGSLLYGYGMLFVSHTLSAAAAFMAFAGIYDIARGKASPRPVSSLWLGMLTAWVTVLEYPGVVVSLCLALYGLWTLGRTRTALCFAVGGALPALAMMHFQWSAFGSPFTPGHLMVENDAFRAAHEQGLYGAVGPTWSSLHGLLFDLGAGLFPLTPVLVLSLPGLWLLWRAGGAERGAAVVASMCALLTLVAIASMNNWRGGWTIGPRYLAVLVPFLGWAALRWLNALWDRWPRGTVGLAMGTAVAGLIASGLPSVYYPHLPPEFTRPVPQLIALLIAHDYAPLNAGTWVGLHGTASMVPLAVAALALVLSSLRGLAGASNRLTTVGVAGVVAGLLIAPVLQRPESEPGVLQAQAFVTRRWSPAGHDRAARIQESIVTSKASGVGPAKVAQHYKELAEVFRAEGRLDEAIRADRDFQRAQHPR